MRVLLVGAGGLVGTAVQAAAPSTIQVVPLRHADLSIEDAPAVVRAVARERPDWIINCAAYTAVDRAEAEPELAQRVNAVGPANLARAARDVGAHLLHLSSDYVFDGTAGRPYREDDAVAPLSVYGRTKLAGEQAIRESLPDAHLIVRSQWLFGEGGSNFVATIVRRARERRELQVVNDQHGCPTSSADLATALWNLIAHGAGGTVHCANAGVATWYDLACAVVATAGLATTVIPCSTADMPRPAHRPAYSALDCSRYATLVGAPLRHWSEALREYAETRSFRA
ncbi:MAG TPA: dTDP-4-dehydrorhamnose reductase [Gemmatimonadales bacterium]|nr:dTDP-4-dehydrorhamnose reductase [Gemmatimonadales bacterium]